MRRLFAVLFAALLLMGGSASLVGAAAQDDATPAPSDGAAVDPAVGDTVPVVDTRGNEFVTATVTEVIRPWEDFGEFEEPERGTEYVAFLIEFENLTDDGIIVTPYEFRLQDSAGFLFDPAFAQGAEDIDLAPLSEDMVIDGGETAEALIVFNIFEEQGLAHLFWVPENETGRLVTLAQLEGE
jgi:hypothetical protein